jgi:hypothetical protein
VTSTLLRVGLVSVKTAVSTSHGTHKVVVRAVASRVALHVLID